MQLATSSLPVPDSPVIKTRASLAETLSISSRTAAICGLSPTMSPANPSSSRSSRATLRDCRSSSAAPIAKSTPSGVNGFSRKLTAPSFVALTASLSPARPLIIITARSGCAILNRARAAMPSSSPGIIRSSSTTSGSSSAAFATPSAPLGASRTSYPSAERSAPTMRRIFGSSSTIRTLGTLWVRRTCRRRRSRRQCGRVPNFGQKLRRKALAFRYPLDFDGYGIDRLFHSLETIHHLARNLRALGLCFGFGCDRLHHWTADDDRHDHRKEPKRDKQPDHLRTHFANSCWLWVPAPEV